MNAAMKAAVAYIWNFVTCSIIQSFYVLFLTIGALPKFQSINNPKNLCCPTFQACVVVFDAAKVRRLWKPAMNLHEKMNANGCFIDYSQLLFAITRSFSPLITLFRGIIGGLKNGGKRGCMNRCRGEKNEAHQCVPSRFGCRTKQDAYASNTISPVMMQRWMDE